MGTFDKFTYPLIKHVEDEYLERLAAYYHHRTGVVHPDGSMGDIRITHKELLAALREARDIGTDSRAEEKQANPNEANLDECLQCKGSLEATGGSPSDGSMICQKCREYESRARYWRSRPKQGKTL